jgi:hypothetical protein
MKRKNILNLIFLAVLTVAAAIILVNNKNKTIPENESDFSVSDTASITKIFIADQNRNKVVLSRKGKDWFVNDEFKVNPSRINMLLDVLKKVEMKNPAPEISNKVWLMTLQHLVKKLRFTQIRINPINHFM